MTPVITEKLGRHILFVGGTSKVCTGKKLSQFPIKSSEARGLGCFEKNLGEATAKSARSPATKDAENLSRTSGPPADLPSVSATGLFYAIAVTAAIVKKIL